LASYITEHGADLVLCGEMAGPGDTGTVPYRIGAKLGLPVLDCVSALGYSEEQGLTAERETETASEAYELLPRLVCAVSSAKRPNLRMALYKDKVAAKGRKVLKARAVRKGRYTPATLRRPPEAGKKAERLEGDPRAAAARIAELAGREAEA
jgi:electron transfer flavoprotein alpha/beta subunit